MTANSAWIQHFTDMARGLLPYRKRLYKVKPQVGRGDIQVVIPTQADVKRAKSDLKRKLKEASAYNQKHVRLLSQSGAGRGKKRTDKREKKKNSGKTKAPKKSQKKTGQKLKKKVKKTQKKSKKK